MRASLTRVAPFVRPYRGRLVLGIAAFGGSRLLEALVPWYLALGIDRIAAGSSDLTLPTFGILLAVIARYGVVTYARYTVRSVGQHVSFDLRAALYAALQRQGATFFARHTIGDMMTRAISDIALIQRLITMGTILVVVLVYATLVGFGFMFYLSPSLTLLMLPPLPFIYLYAQRSAAQMADTSREVQDRLSDLGTHVQENLSGIRTIQAMVQEEPEIRRFAATNQAYGDAFYRQARVSSLLTAWMPSLGALCSVTILGYGGSLVLSGQLSVGSLVAFFMYVAMAVAPFRVAGFIINLFQRAAIASDRLFEVIALEAEIPDRPSGRTPARIRGAIELSHLDWQYPDRATPALSDVSLGIAAGESIAIMGRVGSGKSTLLKLIVRLLDPPPGSIRVDGSDVRDYPLAALRSQIVLVPQDPFLFGEPLAKNLTYDLPERELDAIWSAADAAALKETIERFPAQMATVVGERGVTLSGGQKQRATLARGLIRAAPVLVLDDCFSSVDTATEDHILRALKRVRRGQTTILVSHRVSTARHADRIVVMDQGRIVEVGTHDALIAAGGLYADLERTQREGGVTEGLTPARAGT